MRMLRQACKAYGTLGKSILTSRRAAGGDCASDNFVVKESLHLGTIEKTKVGDFSLKNPKPAKTKYDS